MMNCSNSSAQDFVLTAKPVRIHELWNESAPFGEAQMLKKFTSLGRKCAVNAHFDCK